MAVPALAAVICGFFLEKENDFSPARWTYTFPFVQRFHLCEMPIVGFGGYLTFGLEGLLAGSLVIDDPFRQADQNGLFSAKMQSAQR